MKRQSHFFWVALPLIFMAGCISNPTSSWRNPLGDTFVSYATFRVQLLDSKTREPIPNIEVSRRAPIPFRDSFWSWIWQGDDEVTLTKLGTTNNEGTISISYKDQKANLEFDFGANTLIINCGEKYQAIWRNSEIEMTTLDDIMQKNAEGVIQIFVPPVIAHNSPL